MSLKNSTAILFVLALGLCCLSAIDLHSEKEYHDAIQKVESYYNTAYKDYPVFREKLLKRVYVIVNSGDSLGVKTEKLKKLFPRLRTNFSKDRAEDMKEFVKWCREASELDDAFAQYSLGHCYNNGIGVPKDEKEAVKWYRKAAEQGYAAAQLTLGACYYSGKGVAEDKKEAVKWYRKAAEQGHAGAQYNLGFCYYRGDGVAEDKQEGVKWIRKSAEQGDEKAKKFLSKIE